MRPTRKQSTEPTRDQTLVFYQTICAEINRLRDEQWRLTYYFATEALGFIFLLTSQDTKFIREARFEILFTIVQCIAITMFIALMLITNLYLFQHRQIRRALDGRFGFLEIKDLKGEVVIPISWRGGPVRRFFEYLRLFVPLIAFVVCLQALSIWVIWNGTYQ